MKNSVLVLQSHRDPLPYRFLNTCLASVRYWADFNNYSYRFIGDELFEPIPTTIMNRCSDQPVIATDIGRLYAIERALTEGFDTVVWCDADFLIFNPLGLSLVDQSYAMGREIWIERDERGKLRARVKVHNAFMMYRRGNSFLNFYLDTALRLVGCNIGSLPPQFVGPKLLTALHNVVQLPVVETAAMLSPALIHDLIAGGGSALELHNTRATVAPAGFNLCSSLAANEELTIGEIESVIELLQHPDSRRNFLK
ncbi:MAG: hypothetical protein ACI9GW_002273 [Halieaceae bacterium]